ncbi:transposase [Arthrobacter sp. Hiyo4]|nr:transposase [Arthrobacter sp. Hiyo4]
MGARCGVEPHTVAKWPRRFLERRLDGLVDDPRPGRPASITTDQVEDVVVATLESTPKNASHWSRAKMAERSGLSKSTIGRIWRAFELKPHRTDGFKLSNDPLFVEKVYDVVGLYLNPRVRHTQMGKRMEHQPHTLHLDQNSKTDPRIHRQTSEPDFRRRTLVAPAYRQR